MENSQQRTKTEKGGGTMEIKLTSDQTSEFQKALKIGIYRTLYERDVLTSGQLNYLLKRI